MAIHPKRVPCDLRGHRLSLLDWIFPQMGMVPMHQVSDWVERSRLSLDDDISRLHKNLFVLGPLGVVDPLDEAMQELRSIKPREFQPLSEDTKPFELDFLKDAYEVGKDGKLYFKVYFNVKNFKPEEITVEAEGNKLVVRAQKSTVKGGCEISESVGKTISLPPSVDRQHINATQTSDGVLMVEAPVKDPNYPGMKLPSQTCMAIQPTQPEKEGELTMKGKEGLEIVTAEDGSKKIHLELEVGTNYEPKDIKVWAAGHKIYVHGVKSKADETSESCHKEYSEFLRAFMAQEVIDASKIRAEVKNGCLVVEAPMYK